MVLALKDLMDALEKASRLGDLVEVAKIRKQIIELFFENSAK